MLLTFMVLAAWRTRVTYETKYVRTFLYSLWHSATAKERKRPKVWGTIPHSAFITRWMGWTLLHFRAQIYLLTYYFNSYFLFLGMLIECAVYNINKRFEMKMNTYINEMKINIYTEIDQVVPLHLFCKLYVSIPLKTIQLGFW